MKRPAYKSGDIVAINRPIQLREGPGCPVHRVLPQWTTIRILEVVPGDVCNEGLPYYHAVMIDGTDGTICQCNLEPVYNW